MNLVCDVLVIGGGAAGVGAAVSASKKGAKVILLDRLERIGGILNQCIHSGFGVKAFGSELTGPGFAMALQRQLSQTSATAYLSTFVYSLSPSEGGFLALASSREGIKAIKAKSVVYATGCLERSPGAIGLPGTRPSGVYPAGLAQLYINQGGYKLGNRAFILGSGDIGLIMARRLTLEGIKILGVAEIEPYSNGLARNKAQCLDDFHIPLYLSHTVTKVNGADSLESIVLSRVDEEKSPIPGSEKTIQCDLLLLSVGLLPNVGLLKNSGAKIGPSRGAKVDDRLCSSVKGLYSAGNALEVHDLADEAYFEGFEAGQRAAEHALGLLPDQGEPTEVRAGPSLGYAIPSYIWPNGDEKVAIKFRAKRPHSKCQIVIKDVDCLIKTIKKDSIVPSELQILNIPRNILKNNHKSIEILIEDIL